MRKTFMVGLQITSSIKLNGNKGMENTNLTLGPYQLPDG